MRAYNSTIKIKSKPCKNCGKIQPLFSRGRCQQCAKIEDNKDEPEEGGETLKYLTDDLDTLCSLVVRMSAADENGIAKCYTCGTLMRWQQLQNGHYIRRGKSQFLRWDLRNLRPQCETCNVFKKGNLTEYGKRLDAEKENITEILYEESNLVHSFSREELKGMAVEFNRQLDILKKKLNH